MKILVTGGAGFIGSHVVDLYIEQGHDVVIVDDLSTGRLTNLNPKAVFYQMNICDPRLKEVFIRERPEVVNHHAAQMNVRRSVSDPLFDAEVNVVGSINVIECAMLVGVSRIIYISTGGAVYGEPEYLPCDENHPIIPICQYGISKHTVEHYLYLYFLNYGLESIVLRYPNVYGPRQDPLGEAGVIAIFTGQMLSNEPVTINGDGKQTRDYVYVGDCARANLLSIDVPVSHAIYNLGSGLGTSVNEIFEQLKTLTGYNRDPINGPAKIGETRHIYLDATQANAVLGWEYETSLSRGLEHTVEYFKHSEGLKPFVLDSSMPDKDLAKMGLEQFVEEKSGLNAIGSNPSQYRQRLNNLEQLVAGRSLETLSLRDLLKESMESVQAVSGSVFLLDGNNEFERGSIVFKDQIQDVTSESFEKTINDGLAGWVLHHGQAVLVKDTREDGRWLPSDWDAQRKVGRSVISVPVISNHKVRGALTVACAEDCRFSEDDLAILTTSAALLALSDEKHAWN